MADRSPELRPFPIPSAVGAHDGLRIKISDAVCKNRHFRQKVKNDSRRFCKAFLPCWRKVAVAIYAPKLSLGTVTRRKAHTLPRRAVISLQQRLISASKCSSRRSNLGRAEFGHTSLEKEFQTCSELQSASRRRPKT